MPDNSLDYYLEQKKFVAKLEQSFKSNNLQSTVVGMVKDYDNDRQICLTSVVFIPKDIAKKITAEIIEPLRALDPEQFYFRPENLHLTIKNIRTISDPPLFTKNDIKKADELFGKVIPKSPAFKFQLEDVIGFPTSVSLMGYGEPALRDLVIRLDKGLREINLPDNKKYISDSVFWGNITLCRYTKKPNEKFQKKLDAMRNLKIGTLTINEVNLVTGNVVLNPKTMTIIHTYPLQPLGLSRTTTPGVENNGKHRP